MNSPVKPAAFVVCATIVAIAGLSAIAIGQAPKKVPYKQVQAIFDAKCILCHKAPHPNAKMNLQSYAGVIKGNDDGSVVTPGHPEKSLLYKVITMTGRKQMPPQGPLPKADIAKIEAWIKAGAKEK